MSDEGAMDDDETRRSFLRLLAATPAAGLTLGMGLGCEKGSAGRGRGDVGGAIFDAGFGDAAAGTGDGDAPSRDATPGGDGDGPGADGDTGDAGGDVDGGSCETTGSDVEGPFFREGAPERTVLAPDEESGPRLFIEGTVYQPDCRTPIAGALLDVWSADVDGNYSTTTEDYRLRGQITTDQQGRYAFETVRPGRYRTGGSMRPAHVHFMVSHPGFAPLTTQMYFAGDPYLAPNDPCGGCHSGDPTLIIDLEQFEHEGTKAYRGTFDIVLAA